MELKEIVGWSAGILLSLSVVVEIAPIKLNPWTHIAHWIGQAINGDIIKKVDALSKDVAELRKDMDERNAQLLRVRILRFGDEILHGVQHSKEAFDQVLLEITEYDQYCADHPEFKNNMTVLTVKRIKAVYEKCLDTGSFI